ncbi:MAG: CinA family nicotinamide mononucleotide deamidase-related protein [Acidobacteriota bacterium]
MEAAILAIGSELLGTERLDTNSLRITACLERYGVDLVTKAVIGDDEAAIAEELSRMARADVVIVTGGLGPTEDDRTRAATARAFGRGLTVDEDIVEQIRALFASFGRVMPEVNRRQAEVIEDAAVLHNRAGSAPGQRVDVGETAIFLFPGVPRELAVMIPDHLEPWLAERSRGPVFDQRTLKVACLPESDVEERIAPVYERFGGDAIAVLASPGDIRVVATARGAVEARRATLDEMTRALRAAIGTAVYAEVEPGVARHEGTLEAAVGDAVRGAGLLLATAESCTGGWIGQRLTHVPGSSAWYTGGVVTYSYELKTLLLGVPTEMLETHGAVSDPVVRAMARGARQRLGADIAVAVSGIAGPGGGTDEKPVGTVHLAVAGSPDDGAPGADEDGVQHWQVHFPGDRERIRQLTTQLALEHVRRRVLAISD